MMLALVDSTSPEPRALISLDAFSEIVGALYECALQPAGWPAVLDRIRAAVGASACWIGQHWPDEVRSAYQIEVGTDPDYQRRMRESYVPMSPFTGVPYHLSDGDVFTLDDVIDYDEFLASRFHREWSGPQGFLDCINAILVREADRFTWLGLCMPERVRPGQKALAAAFRPHVERAIRISDLLERRAAEAADLAETFETLATGVVLVDADREVRGINPAAIRLMKAARDIGAAGGRLTIGRRGAGAALSEALAACAGQRLDRAGATVLFDAVEDDAPGLIVHVLPIRRPATRFGPPAVAALLLTNPAAPPRPSPVEALVRRYGLTQSETRVLLGLIEGKSPRAIALAQGVAMPTVRTHLSRLYDKTGATGQTGIVRLVAGLSQSL